MKSFKWAVAIPAFNPDEQLLQLLDDLSSSRNDCLLLIVNDGSSAESQKYFQLATAKNCCAVIEHTRNLGKGRALKSAFAYLLEKHPQIAGVVTADCDGQHSAEDILRCLDLLEKNPESFILSEREFDHRKMPWKSRCGNYMAKLIFRKLFNLDLRDTQCGLRGIPRDFMAIMADKPGDRYEFESLMLLEANSKRNQKNFPIKTFSIEARYFNGNRGSHFRKIRDSLKVVYILLKSYFNGR